MYVDGCRRIPPRRMLSQRKDIAQHIIHVKLSEQRVCISRSAHSRVVIPQQHSEAMLSGGCRQSSADDFRVREIERPGHAGGYPSCKAPRAATATERERNQRSVPSSLAINRLWSQAIFQNPSSARSNWIACVPTVSAVSMSIPLPAAPSSSMITPIRDPKFSTVWRLFCDREAFSVKRRCQT